MQCVYLRNFPAFVPIAARFPARVTVGVPCPAVRR